MKKTIRIKSLIQKAGPDRNGNYFTEKALQSATNHLNKKLDTSHYIPVNVNFDPKKIVGKVTGYDLLDKDKLKIFADIDPIACQKYDILIKKGTLAGHYEIGAKDLKKDKKGKYIINKSKLISISFIQKHSQKGMGKIESDEI